MVMATWFYKMHLEMEIAQTTQTSSELPTVIREEGQVEVEPKQPTIFVQELDMVEVTEDNSSMHMKRRQNRLKMIPFLKIQVTKKMPLWQQM